MSELSSYLASEIEAGIKSMWIRKVALALLLKQRQKKIRQMIPSQQCSSTQLSASSFPGLPEALVLGERGDISAHEPDQQQASLESKSWWAWIAKVIPVTYSFIYIKILMPKQFGDKIENCSSILVLSGSSVGYFLGLGWGPVQGLK